MRILVASKINPESLDELRGQHDVVSAAGASEDSLAELIADREALVFRSGVSITERVLSAARDLRLVVRAGSGYDNIDLEFLRDMRVRVIRIPSPGARAVAEMSFTFMLALARQLFWADANWRNGHWVKAIAEGRLLGGRTLGIVGAGNIGAQTGELGAAWGMSVLGCVEHPSEAVARSLRARGVQLADFHQVLEESDFISIHVPLQPSTQGLIDSAELDAMRRGSYLINLSRGGVVNEQALRAALVDGRLGGAALDVHELEGEGHVSGLADLQNVILTPHIGASTVDSQRQIGEIIVEAVKEFEFEPVTEKATIENFIVR